MQEEIKVFLENVLRMQLYISGAIDLDFTCLNPDELGIDDSCMADLRTAIEDEYGIDTSDLIADDDTLDTLADKIADKI